MFTSLFWGLTSDLLLLLSPPPPPPPLVSSCITTYKKTPPPVPPRTTPSKPFISITAQSSTESAQDAYLEGGCGGISSGAAGLSNSTESIDSMKALTAAIEAANAQVHGPPSQHVTNSVAVANRVAVATGPDSREQREALRKCLSIGIQVRFEPRSRVSVPLVYSVCTSLLLISLPVTSPPLPLTSSYLTYCLCLSLPVPFHYRLYLTSWHLLLL